MLHEVGWRSERTRHRILILIDEVFGDILHHELVCLVGHPCVHKGREVKIGGAIERELVVNELIRCLRFGALRWSVSN